MIPQHLQALDKGNALRMHTATVKRAIATGELHAAEVIAEGSVPLTVGAALTAIPRVHWAKAGQMLTEAERRLSDDAVAPARLCFDHQIAGAGMGRRRVLTDRERLTLADVVAEHETGPVAARRAQQREYRRRVKAGVAA